MVTVGFKGLSKKLLETGTCAVGKLLYADTGRVGGERQAGLRACGGFQPYSGPVRERHLRVHKRSRSTARGPHGLRKTETNRTVLR